MGLRGLQSFLERNRRDFIETKSIVDLIAHHKNDDTSKLLVILDGRSLMGWLLEAPLIPLFDLRVASQKLSKLSSFLDDLQLNVVAYFGGNMANKIEYQKNMTYKLEDIHKLKLSLEGNTEINNEKKLNRRNSLMQYKDMSTIIFASYFKVINSTAESESELLNYAKQHNCFAIIAQDSDYIAYKNFAKYYWPIYSIDYTKKTVDTYNIQRIAEYYHIDVEHLPLLLGGLGNEVLTFDMLVKNSVLFKKGKFNIEGVLLNTGKIISKHRGVLMETILHTKLNDIARKIFGTNKLTEMYKKSILKYETGCTNPIFHRRCHFEKNSTSQALVNDVKCLIEKNMVQKKWIVTILENHFLCQEAFQDFNVTPQSLELIVYETLRRKVLGLATRETIEGSFTYNVTSAKYNPITRSIDLIHSEEQSITPTMAINCSWKALCAPDNKEHENLRWEVFLSTVSDCIEPEKFKSLGPKFYYTVIILDYLLNNKVNGWHLEHWEAMAILCRDPISKFARKTNNYENIRALEVISVFMTGFSYINLLLMSAGYPITPEQLLGFHTPDQPFNGLNIYYAHTFLKNKKNFKVFTNIDSEYDEPRKLLKLIEII